MSPVFSGVRVRRLLALVAGLLALHVPLQSYAADRPGPSAKARKAAEAAAPRKVVAQPASKSRIKSRMPARVSAVPLRKQVGPRAVKDQTKVQRAGTARTRNGRIVKTTFAPRMVVPQRPSIGNAIGLHLTDDPLDLRSSVALAIDQTTGEVLFEKNSEAVLPIASITKVMTSMVVLDAGLPLDEMLDVSDADRDTERHSGSRLAVGSKLSRGEMLQLALMASENRAAHALGRHFPGGMSAFVEAMNAKARAIGMTDSRFADPTGLSGDNVSNARDLARMVRAAHGYPLIREYSTAASLKVDTGYRQVGFRTTNRLIDNPDWDIGMQKTGYISEAGKCLVMQARIEGRSVILVLLDAVNAQSRFADAQRLRKWVEQRPASDVRAVRVDSRS
ncbi:MAG: D-alanyl-D-alanine endopeptidase [Burkholderiales bacterium]|nr:MAG: D-alanyl-D-alanine endopeptidase [Burkholderiales bacterium]